MNDCLCHACRPLPLALCQQKCAKCRKAQEEALDRPHVVPNRRELRAALRGRPKPLPKHAMGSSRG